MKFLRFSGNLERAVRIELTNHGFAIRSLGLLATRAELLKLEREERLELSKRVWKTRMLPATSLPLGLEPPAGIEPASVRSKRTALIPLNYGGTGFWSIVSDLNRRFRHGEPVSSVRARRTMLEWSGWPDSNRREHVPKTCGQPLSHIQLNSILIGSAASGATALRSTPDAAPPLVKSLVRQQGLEP